MAFEMTTRVWINCDGCGVSHGEDQGLPATPLGKRNLQQSAIDNGWIRKNGKQYCDSCVAKGVTDAPP